MVLSRQLINETSRSFDFTDNDELSALSVSAMIARSEIPASHRRIADNFVFFRKVYGFPVIQGQLSRKERVLLEKYDFNRLEFSTIKQINEELNFLKTWSFSVNRTLRLESDELLTIRAKELKFIFASKHSKITSDMFNGYLALEKYFDIISTYNQ
ncbi:MAG: hypothetical protein ACI4CY_06205 [Candidatus Gastranaerophilaceae bacterium]